ncbi:MAG: ABC transporter ATP-binding protein [Planctomycetes bacterium]|nr:ABC transporter ATP-binding protein [Planctomycetota bacterium]
MSADRTDRAEPVMLIRDLVKTYGQTHAVDHISFDLYGGEVHGFIGPNGAGKTTTMRLMAGVEPPDAGDVVLNGGSIVADPNSGRRDIGFMPDYLDSYPGLDVWEYLDFYARLYGQKPPYRRRRLADVVEFTRLGDKLGQQVESLSKGWKQRLSLARVLLNNPRVLILDEPAAGLDPKARMELRDLVAQLAASGKAVFISSHILSELSEMCISATVIHQGKIRGSGPIELLGRAGTGEKVVVELLHPSPDEISRLARFLLETPGILSAEPGMRGAHFSHASGGEFQASLLVRLIAADFRLIDYHAAATSLEQAFIAMTETEGENTEEDRQP